MTHLTNPFKASFGTSPPLLVGRDAVREEFEAALDEGPGTHERISLIIGPRGIGKTVLLNTFEDSARERGWHVISETAGEGFAPRIRDQILRLIRQLALDESMRARFSSLNLSFAGVSFGITFDPDTRQLTSQHTIDYTLRHALDDLLTLQAELDRQASQPPSGVLISLDELHHQRAGEVAEFGAAIQHLVREGREIAVVMAGIPSSVQPLLSGRTDDHNLHPATFLRRANRIELGKVADDDVRAALREPVRELGVRWESAALELAVAACDGYPFMIQLVGQWTLRTREGKAITRASAERGVEKAREKLGQLVHEPALADLSEIDRAFLTQMATDNGPSKISDIAKRMKKSRAYVARYRRRLINTEMILETARGEVDFALPYMREYLRSHADTLTAG